MPHNVFISWSGESSKSIALVLHEWLPTVLQAVDPFMSDRDIDAGTRGLVEIADQLKEIKIGIMCVTASNQGSPWLNFEAGALSKLIAETYVIPLAFDVESGQVKQPLGQFQAKQFEEDDMWQVIKTISRALSTNLPEERLQPSFKRGWPELNQKIESLRVAQQAMEEFEEPKRTAEDMLEELIVAVRDQTALLKNPPSRPDRQGLMASHFAATDAALRTLGQYYGLKGPMTANQLMQNVDSFDDDDWTLIENTPFLNWYLTVLNNKIRPQPPEADTPPNDFDDVPF